MLAPLSVTSYTLDVNSLGLKDQSYTGTVDEIAIAAIDSTEFGFIQLGNYGNGIQMRDRNNDNTSKLWNYSQFARGIERIELTYSSSKNVDQAYDDAMIFNFGNTDDCSSYRATLSTVAGEKTYIITPNTNAYTFFYLEYDSEFVQYWDSIKIVLNGYEE